MNVHLCFAAVAVSSVGLIAAHAQTAQADDQPLTVATESGQVSGIAIDLEVTAFRGIPYAAPPVGPRRWQPPAPPVAWEGVRKCRSFGSKAVQTDDPDEGSEDCLFLNVWTGGAGEEPKLPVMVWIHGGGLANGSGHEPQFDGLHFARSGVVVVTINYRLGALGFFSHPQLSAESKQGVSGNYGFLDQLAALRWVQNNISGFGGDPNNVTIFGQSAGGTSVYVLVASPLAKGLFHRAILQSPWLDYRTFRHLKNNTYAGPAAETENADRAAAWLEQTDEPVAALRKLSAQQVTAELGRDQPVVVDEWLLPDFPDRIYAAGKQNQVPSMAGTTRDEGTIFAARSGVRTVAEFNQSIEAEFGKEGAALIDFYQVAETGDVRKGQSQRVTDAWFVYPTRRYCEAMADQGNPTWMYQFTRRSTTHPYLGATHGAEVPFVFNSVEPERMVGINKKIADLMKELWVNFATNGDPNAGRIRGWSKYTAEQGKYLLLGPKVSLGSGLRQEAYDLYDTVFTAIRARQPQ